MNLVLTAAAIVSLPAFLYFLFDRYKKPSFVVDLDQANIILAKLFSPGSQIHGNFCLCFLNVAIVNSGTKNASVKDLQICYRLDGDIHRESSIVICTTEIMTPNGANKVAVASMPMGDNIVMMSWSDFRIVNHNKGVIESGDRIIFNVVFPVLANTIQEVEEIFQDGFFEIGFYHGSSLKYSYFIPDKLKSGPTLWLRNETFQTDVSGQIQIPPLVV